MSLDITAAADRFRAEGFLVWPGFLDAEAAHRLEVELGGRVAEGRLVNPDSPARQAYERERETVVSVHAAQDLPAVQAAFARTDLSDLTTAVLGAGWIRHAEAAIFCTPAPGGSQGWHQDTTARDPGQFILNRICFPVDLRADQGALWVVPGSHRQGDIPPGGNHEDLPGQVEVRPTAGSLVLLHSRCFHRVGPNLGTVPRIQVNQRARPATAAQDLTRRPLFRTGAWDFVAGRG